MTRALLAGAFGQGNPGDEALLCAFLRELEGCSIVATSRVPDQTAAAHDCETVPAVDPRSVFAESRRAGAVIFGGGTVFKTLHPSTRRPPLDLLRRGFLLATGARTLGKRVALLGVGATELDGLEARFLARGMARACDLLVVRDEESAAILARTGVRPPLRIGADPTWVLSDGLHSNDAPQRSDAVVVALNHHAGGSKLPRWLASALRPFSQEGIQILLLPWQDAPGPLDDEVMAAEVHEELGSGAEILPPPRDLADACRVFASSRLVVGLRFHALVASAVAATPFVAVGHEEKLIGLARRLGQTAVRPDVEPALLAKSVAASLDAPGPAPAAIRAEVDQAREAFRLLRLLLAEGRLEDAESIAGLPLGPSPWLA